MRAQAPLKRHGVMPARAHWVGAGPLRARERIAIFILLISYAAVGEW